MVNERCTRIVLAVGLLVLCVSAAAVGRTMRRTAQFEQLASSLNDGEIIVWVPADGTPSLVVRGTYCGEIALVPDRFSDSETYKAEFFGPLDEKLREKAGKSIDQITDLFVFFEPGISEEAVLKYRAVFRRYRVHCINCCDKSSGYSCCPITLDTWFVETSFDQAVERMNEFHALEISEVNQVEVVVVSDGSLEKLELEDDEEESKPFSFLEWLMSLFAPRPEHEAPSLVRWLERELPHAPIHRLELTVSPEGGTTLAPRNPNWTILPDSLVLLIVVFDAPEEHTLAVRAAVEEAALQELARHQEDPLVILLTFPDPTSATVAPSLIDHPFTVMQQGTVFVSATEQPADLLADTVHAVQEALPTSVGALVDTLRPLGLLSYQCLGMS